MEAIIKKQDEMKDLAERLKKVNEEILEKFGTESYELRCKIYDIHKELQKQDEEIFKLKVEKRFYSNQCESECKVNTKLKELLQFMVNKMYD